MAEGVEAEASGDRAERRKRTLEMVAVIVLSITSVLTAWSAFESSKWGGAMSIAFSEASSARIEAGRLDGAANVRVSNQLGLWTQWASATTGGNTQLASFLADRFPEPLASAHRDWLAAGGTQQATYASPFDMPSYVLPEREQAKAADARAADRFSTALENNQRGDNYTILTVLFATVLFFTALSGRVTALAAQQLLLGVALVFAVVGVVFLAIFPKLV